MSYVVSGHVRGLGAVSVEISQQAERPREPARPSPAKATSSSMMSSRALRPREPAPPGVTGKFLDNLAAYKGQQAELERILKLMGDELNVAKNALRKCSERNDRACERAMRMQCVRIEAAIAKCVSMIKACAAKANVAAESAIAHGATRGEVKETASAPIAKAETVAVESTTVHVTPSGQIVPGPDATVVATPTLSEPGNVKTQDVTVSSGTIGTVALVGAAAVLGYLFLRKKGHA